MIVFTEPSAVPVEMTMRIRALLTSVVAVITPPRMMAEEDRARSMPFFDQPDLRGNWFSPPRAP
jgi:hypothetical protein